MSESETKNLSIEGGTQDTGVTHRRTIYLFPNLLTTGALLFGFFAMVLATQGHFSTASLFIFFAAILDGMDGRVARLFHAQSKFGEQYDSLSDMISFGAAPAITAYLYSLNEFGRFGTVVAGVYCIAAALRLARFNARSSIISKKFFQGLPSPAAATMIASLIYTLEQEKFASEYSSVFLLIVVLMVGLLMVSSIPFYSFKEIDPRRAIPFKILLLLAFFASFIYLSPHVTIFSALLIYSSSGLFVWVWRLVRGGKMKVLIGR